MRQLTAWTQLHEQKRSTLWLSFGSIVVSVLKCAVCPVCLGTFGSVIAGARVGLLADERLHGGLIVFAIAVDALTLGASMRHHRRQGPLQLCAAGASIAVSGHFIFQAVLVEYLGFAILLGASLWNARLLLQHVRVGGTCCAHAHDHHPHDNHRGALHERR